MQIKKAAEALSSGAPTAMQLESINAQAKAKLTAEQIYVFEDMLPTLVEVMDWLADTEAGRQLLQVMQGHEALWNYYQNYIS